MRPPDPEHGEDEAAWLERARAAAARAPFGLHTHWTSPTHARPTGGDPAARVRAEAAWMREHGLEPRFFCGGGWYTDDGVRAAVAELGLVDCTPRDGVARAGRPADDALARRARPRRARGRCRAYVHAYFHDYDLLDPRGGGARAALAALGGRSDAASIALALTSA